MKKTFHHLLALCALVWTALSFSACFNMDANLYNPTPIDEYKFNASSPDDWQFDLPDEYRIPDSLIQLLRVTSQFEGEGGSETIYGVYLGDTNRIATDTVIVYCHGNGGYLDNYWSRISLLANLGGKNNFGVLAMDYRGYGRSTGTPSEDGLYADVDACVQWLAASGLTGDRLVMYGYSLGTAPACELTANPRTLDPMAVILEAPFASAEMMGQASTGLDLPGSFYTTLQIDNAEEIRKVDQAFCWFHGTEDSFIDYEAHGQAVWDNYSGTRGLALPAPGGTHGNAPFAYGLSAYVEAMGNFIQGK